jgi:hypothetical protein
MYIHVYIYIYIIVFNLKRCRFLALSPVLCWLTHSLSDDPVLSIFFSGGLCSYFHVVDTVVLVSVSDFFLFCSCVDANLNIYLHFAYMCILTCLLTYSKEQSPS